LTVSFMAVAGSTKAKTTSSARAIPVRIVSDSFTLRCR
jgi:hypothetical protein